ncbi:hypothetical protein ACIPEQ_13400 [Curtobacterium sp. NPDC087080]|uniref:hypothetical protein n=1 Tax=Curtobacterium sp. NPDC087080 TaxID=3363965 RepID=UPI0037F141BF
MDWWSAPWWAGVQGVASVVGITAIAIAVVDFLIRMNLEAPNAMSITVRRVGANLVDARATVEVTIIARPMGPHVLYEPEWRVWGDDSVTPPWIDSPVLDVRDEAVEMTMHVHRDRLKDIKVGIEWVVPRRFGSYKAASRRGIAAMSDYERWVVYRWRYWPRKTNGYWRKNREAKKRNPLFGPE